MKGTGQALSHGAISILNAFPTGKGGALGVDLWTRAKVSLREGPGQISGFVSSDPQESNRLAITVAQKTMEHYGYERKLQGEVITSSNIPVAVGLKSSSAAANAVALATASAIDEKIDDDTLVGIGIDASIESGVSLTGAYDDSFASYHGGAVLTDNDHRKVEKVLKIPRDLKISRSSCLFHREKLELDSWIGPDLLLSDGSRKWPTARPATATSGTRLRSTDSRSHPSSEKTLAQHSQRSKQARLEQDCPARALLWRL